MSWVAERNGARPMRWLAGAGTIGPRLQSINWSATPLGAVEHWPQSLQTSLSLCLSFPDAACLVWGPSRLQLFNDAYEAFCAPRRSPEPGQDFAECWRDLWPTIGPHFERARGGEAARVEDAAARLAGNAMPPFTLSFIPVRDELDAVGGVLVIVDASRSSDLARNEADLAALDYTVSHDLHAPVRTMQAMARILAEEQATQPTGSTGPFLEQFAKAAEKLSERIEGLVRFRGVTRRTLNRRRVDTNDIVKRLIAAQSASEQGRNVSMVTGELPDAFGDHALVQQVFATVLSNALKFTRHAPAPRIEIGARRAGDRIVYFVSDNGAGFDMKYAEKLFRLFQRLHGEAQFAGAGVELALAKRIVERHGGAMWAEARKDEGAMFQFSLPAADAGPTPAS